MIANMLYMGYDSKEMRVKLRKFLKQYPNCMEIAKQSSSSQTRFKLRQTECTQLFKWKRTTNEELVSEPTWRAYR